MEFNVQRLGLLLHKDIKELLLKSIAIISLIYFIIITINLAISFFAVNSHSHTFNIYGNFLVLFFISCSILGSICWEEINKRPTRIEYLALPASTLEKVSSKFISVAILFPTLMIVLFFVMRAYAVAMNFLIGNKLMLDNMPDVHQYDLFNVGAIIIAVFAYGSIKFNTASFPKTIVWLLALFAAFAALSFIIAFITFPELRNEIFGIEQPQNVIHTNNNIEDFWVITWVKKLFYVIPLFFWGMSFYTLKEKEA